MFQGSARPDTVKGQFRGRSTTTSSSPFALVAAPPTRLRRGLPADVWCGVACWWSPERWVAHVRLVYLRHYQLLRPALVAATGGGVSLEAVLAVAATHAGVADHRTGRSSRPLLGTSETTTGLVAATGFARRTVSRVRTFLRLAGLVTEVAGGRHRSLAERMESWRRGDRARGWTAVYALHPSRTHPVDRSPGAARRLVVVVAHWSRGGTPPRSGSVPTPTPVDTAVSTGEPHRQVSRSSQRRTPDALGLDLALRWRRHPRAPDWVMAVSPAAWSALLALPARHGWTAADLNQLLRDHVAEGSVVPDRPNRPVGFVSWLLHRLDLAERPTIRRDAARAEDVRLATQRKRQQAEQRREAPRRAAAALAALHGPGRAAVQAVLDDITSRRRAVVPADAVSNHQQRKITSGPTVSSSAEADRRYRVDLRCRP